MRLPLLLFLLGLALPGVSATIPAADSDSGGVPPMAAVGEAAPPPETPRPAASVVPLLEAATINHLLSIQVPERMEFCGEPVPLERPDVAERLDLELAVILGNPVATTLWFKRLPRYFPGIEAELERRGLPQDLKYVALVESNLRASARSSAGAVGPWQFMGGTGREMGLEHSAWADERRDWDKATSAALDYLSALRESFDSWPAALAAYNAGRQRVSNAMEEQQHIDYYDLVLPRETERYVFRMLAAKLVIENPEQYGIRVPGARLYAPLDVVVHEFRVRRRELPVAAVAGAAGVPYRELRRLNPWLLGAPLPRGTYRVQVPTANVGSFDGELARWEAANPEPQKVYYAVRRGDTLSAIASRHSVSLHSLLQWNRLNARSIIRPGQELVIQLVD
ncbi:MAG: transglycosylase SLT domain-containing protein [Deferrisomatales bacterium]|nr:transglycosylase SLT domain-containing protein [Deferrisomatales bacterium]